MAPKGKSAEEQMQKTAEKRWPERADPEGFFVPHIWSLVVKSSPDINWSPAKVLLFPIANTKESSGGANAGAAATGGDSDDESLPDIQSI